MGVQYFDLFKKKKTNGCSIFQKKKKNNVRFQMFLPFLQNIFYFTILNKKII